MTPWVSRPLAWVEFETVASLAEAAVELAAAEMVVEAVEVVMAEKTIAPVGVGRAPPLMGPLEEPLGRLVLSSSCSPPQEG